MNIFFNELLVRDSALKYASELIGGTTFKNKKTGYQILLSPEIRDLVCRDSLDKYLSDYCEILESYFNENEYHLAMIQQSFYNYSVHEKERLKAESDKERLKFWIVAVLLCILALVIVVLILRNRNEHNLLRLHQALDNINLLNQKISGLSQPHPGCEEVKLVESEVECNEDEVVKENESVSVPTVSDLRARLRQSLLSMYENGVENPEAALTIKNSNVYEEIKSCLDSERIIREDSSIWKEVEELVFSVSPNFKSNLQLLTGGKITMQEWRTSLLIKCGFTPSQLVVLLGRTKGAISSRRESICIKVFDQKLGTKVIDGIIRLL